jgi:hypothetical protein
MQYVNGFEIGGIPAKQIPCIPGRGVPGEATEGVAGCLYMDTDTGELYKCTGVVDGLFIWSAIGGGSSSEYAQPEWGVKSELKAFDLELSRTYPKCGVDICYGASYDDLLGVDPYLNRQFVIGCPMTEEMYDILMKCSASVFKATMRAAFINETTGESRDYSFNQSEFQYVQHDTTSDGYTGSAVVYVACPDGYNIPEYIETSQLYFEDNIETVKLIPSEYLETGTNQPEWGHFSNEITETIHVGYEVMSPYNPCVSMSPEKYDEIMTKPGVRVRAFRYDDEISFSVRPAEWLSKDNLAYDAEHEMLYIIGSDVGGVEMEYVEIYIYNQLEKKEFKFRLSQDFEYSSAYISAPMTEDEYRMMMASEDFKGIYDDKYSGIYNLSPADFDYSGGCLRFTTEHADKGATVNIHFTNVAYAKIPLEYMETPDQSIPHLTGTDKNPIRLYDLKVGSYIIDGKVMVADTQQPENYIPWWKQFVIISPVPAQNAVYAQAFYPASHAIHRYAMVHGSDGIWECTISKVYLNDLASNDEVGSKRLVGTSKNPICLRNLATGSYVVDGTIKLYPTESATRSWDETLINVSQKSDGTTTYVQAHFPASHSIHLFTITDSKSTLTSTSLSKILEDIAALKAHVGIS